LTTINAVETDKRVDLEISKVKVDIDRVETNEEIDKSGLLLGRDMLEKSRGDLVACGERLANKNV